jgi:hypothetical protein
MNKTKHPTKGEKLQDGKTQVLANEGFSKEGRQFKKKKKNKSSTQTPHCKKHIK